MDHFAFNGLNMHVLAKSCPCCGSNMTMMGIPFTGTINRRNAMHIARSDGSKEKSRKEHLKNAERVAKEVEVLKHNGQMNNNINRTKCNEYIKELNQYADSELNFHDRMQKDKILREYKEEEGDRQAIADYTKAWIEAVSIGKTLQDKELHEQLLEVERKLKERDDADNHYFTLREVAQNITDNQDDWRNNINGLTHVLGNALLPVYGGRGETLFKTH